MKERWNKIDTPKFLGLTVTLAGLGFWFTTAPDGFVPGFDHVNHLLHRVGHLVFGSWGMNAGIYGAVLAQLAVPLFLTIAFWKGGETIPCAASGVWFCENLLDISHYMADATAQKLPLPGCGKTNDWQMLFSQWNVLGSQAAIASGVWLAGWAGMVIIEIWLFRRWRHRHDKSPF